MKAICSCLALSMLAAGAAAAPDSDVLDIGSRRELFVDDYLIESIRGLERVLQQPVRREVVMDYDRLWEGNTCIYQSIFWDGYKFRMYYRAAHFDETQPPPETAYQNRRPPLVCYAESTDGIHWNRPMLGLVEVNGSTENNVVWPPTGRLTVDGDLSGAGGLMVFKDHNPHCSPEEQYKGVSQMSPSDETGKRRNGLSLFVSPNGIHWSIKQHWIITDGEFDALNQIFWDGFRGRYVTFYRDGGSGLPGGGYRVHDGYRAIATAVSPDALTWPKGRLLEYGDAPREQLYDPAIVAYHRAPHLFVGFPLRYIPHRSVPGSTHVWSEISDVLFMSSRDGLQWKRWPEAFLRPGPQIGRPEHYRWGGHCNSMMPGAILETKSDIPGAPNELSIYSIEGYYSGKSSQLRRYTLRLDGFVALHATAAGGEMVTRPLQFKGGRLTLNFATSAAGSVQVELQDVEGQPLDGFALADCPEIYGDRVDHVVEWKGGHNVSEWAGTPVRLRFVMKDADLYAIQFR